jgi:hypothetical protein
MLSSIAWNPRPTTTTQTSASPLGVASNAVAAAGCPRNLMLFPAPGPWPPAPIVPIPAHARSRIALKVRHLPRGTRIFRLPNYPCDASCKKVPPDASQNLDPRTQPIEKEELKTS